MSDYGHELAFGVFLTPTSQLPERVMLDLVTFQDHPYQPAFLDT